MKFSKSMMLVVVFAGVQSGFLFGAFPKRDSSVKTTTETKRPIAQPTAAQNLQDIKESGKVLLQYVNTSESMRQKTDFVDKTEKAWDFFSHLISNNFELDTKRFNVNLEAQEAERFGSETQEQQQLSSEGKMAEMFNKISERAARLTSYVIAEGTKQSVNDVSGSLKNWQESVMWAINDYKKADARDLLPTEKNAINKALNDAVSSLLNNFQYPYMANQQKVKEAVNAIKKHAGIN